MNKIIKLLFCHSIVIIFTFLTFASVADLRFSSPRVSHVEKLYDKNKKILKLADLEGNVLVLYFWASWCSGCASTITELDALQGRLKRDNVLVLPISLDSSGVVPIVKFYEEHGIKNLPLFHDYGNKLFASLSIDTVPTAIVLNTEGKIIATSLGNVDWSSDAVISKLKNSVKPLSEVNKSYVDLMKEHKSDLD